MKPEFIDGWSTHQFPLITAAMNTEGPIVEFGCGNYSTPLLHAIAKKQQREFTVYSSDGEWAKSFMDLADSITVIRNEQWKGRLFEHHAGLLFVDSEQSVKDREPQIRRYADQVEVIVIHDAQVLQRGKTLQPLMEEFKYSYHWQRLSPKATTAVFSQHIDVSQWF